MRRKAVVWSALAGALAGAAASTFPLLPGIAHIEAFRLDRELLAHSRLLLAGVACWALFGVYWDIAAKNAAAAQKSESGGSRGVHVFLTNAAMLLEMGPIHGLGRFVAASIGVMAIGLSVEAAGLGMAIWARRHLGRNWSGEITIKVEHELIRSGPYHAVRHPIYTGIVAMYVGLALLTGERLAIIGLAVALFAYWRKIRLEEAMLEAAFGQEYDTYRRSTWALVPGVF